MNTDFYKRSGFSMIELVFVIVILGVLAAVAVPRFVATRTDAQVATARSDMAAAQKAIVAKVFADNIDATIGRAPDPNIPVRNQTLTDNSGGMTWGEWIINISGLDGSRWGINPNPGGDILSSATNPVFGGPAQGWVTVDKADDAVAPIGNTKSNALGGNRVGKGFCGPVLGIAAKGGGFMIFNPTNAGMPFKNSASAGYMSSASNDFCLSFGGSYMSSGGTGNKVVPLASTGTIEF